MEENRNKAELKRENWLFCFYKDDEIDQDIPDYEPLDGITKVFVWNFTKDILQKRYKIGMAGQACYLYERFITARLRNLQPELIPGNWEETKKKLLKQMPLYLGVCVQLVFKMHSRRTRVTLSALRRTLLKIENYSFSNNELSAVELEVYKEMDFRIPSWTNVQKAQIMAHELHMKSYVLQGVAYVMDIADYYRSAIQIRVHNIASKTEASSSRNPSTMKNIRSMHLVAGAVAATAMYMHFLGPDPLPKLAAYTKCPKSYIKTIAHVILKCLLNKKNVIPQVDEARSLLMHRS